jgi:hypothetical protein
MSKKILIILGVLLGLGFIDVVVSNFNQPQPQVQGAQTQVVQPTVSAVPIVSIIPVPTLSPSSTPNLPSPNPKPTPQSTDNTNSGLSNDNYYTNSSGNTVHSPAYSDGGGVPAGATAQCGDGTYSFSQHRQGTCSHHGGVSQWL